MQKKTKGAIAAGGAVLLLAGGAGSLAYWSDSENIAGSQINSGELSLDPSAVDGWYDVSTNPGPGAPGTKIDPASFKVVPGDTLEYRSSVVIRAKGQNLRATMKADPSGITGSNELASRISTSLTTTGAGPDITEADAGKKVNVVVTVKFDPATPDQVAQNQTVDLNALKITLAQNNRA
ncbi:hypothetical protein GCM10009624_05320 [Gordonia sinesedis]